jgi:hypothetical protein
MFGQFYNKNLRKLVVGFGSLFSNIIVEHENPDGGDPLQIRVPILYSPQEKFIQRLLQPSSIDDSTKIETQLPKLSYIITSVVVDPTRRRNKFSEVTSLSNLNGNCLPSGSSIYHEVPVNVNFSLYVYTRHIDDTLQIVEQIIPYFNPEHFITLNMNEVHPALDIPIIMTQNNLSERYDGDLSSRRINISTINFVAKSYIFGKIFNTSTIQHVGVTMGIDYTTGINYKYNFD